MSGAFGRRALLRRGALVAVAMPALLAFGPGDQLVLRNARFVERDEDVFMEIEIPELFPAGDREARRAIESGIATRLVFDLGVFRSYARTPMRVLRREVQIWHNQWATPTRYEVTVIDDGRKGRARHYATPEEAVNAAVRLRVRIASVAELGRGRNATYYVRLSALRNPIGDQRVVSGEELRSRNQDVTYLRRWISVFVRARIRAEVALDVRALPDFYLPPPKESAAEEGG